MKCLIFAFFFISHVTYAALNDVDKAFISPKNILKNPGFETVYIVTFYSGEKDYTKEILNAIDSIHYLNEVDPSC